jgi:hypothetical protein
MTQTYSWEAFSDKTGNWVACELLSRIWECACVELVEVDLDRWTAPKILKHWRNCRISYSVIRGALDRSVVYVLLCQLT